MHSRPIVARINSGGGEGDEGLRGELREALSHWASGVTVVAVRDDDEVLALTVSAFVPVSMDPPLVLVSLGAHAGLLPSLEEAGRFTASLLPESAATLAANFAQGFTPSPSPFPAEGDPVLRGALASLVCRTAETHAAGDHKLVIGEVERVVLGEDVPPLVYYRRGYRGVR